MKTALITGKLQRGFAQGRLQTTSPAAPTSLQRILGNGRAVLILKWAASIVQIMGYSATAFGLTPLNIYLFLIGLIGWFMVGVMWRDKAIMLIHIVALGAIMAGLASS